jgi:hypothetical protein
VLIDDMNANVIQPTPAARLRRMQRMFSKFGGIFIEDYEFFRRQPQRDVSTRPNKVVRMSAKARGPQAQALN